MPRHAPVVPLGSAAVLAMCLLAAPLPVRGAMSSDVHLVHRFTIHQESTPLVVEQRDVYIQGTNIALQNSERWLLIRPDLQRVWLLDHDRQAIADLHLDQFRADVAGTLTTLIPQGSLPPIQSTTETRRLHGLGCRVYRAASQLMTVEACVTRQLPGLERFQGLLGGPPDIPGVPIDFTVLVQPPTQPPVAIRQTLIAVDTTPLDPALFALPAGSVPAPQKQTR